MPRLGGVTVHVTDIKGNDLEEWGVQRLPSQGRASAYIKSTSNMGFRVTVRPRLPFMDPWVSARDKGLKTNMKMDRNKSYSSPIKPPRGASYSSPPPFHLLASLFLDGRQKPERRIVVYLDPDDEDFSQPDGKVKFKSRWVQGHDGNLEEHSWVFRDIGIESAFDKLFIGGIQDQSGDLVLPDEESMIALMDSAKIGDGGGLESHERPNVGQISVTLQRVVLGKKWIQDNYRPKHKGNEMQDVDMGGIKQEITHTAG